MADHPALVALEYNIIYNPMQVSWLTMEPKNRFLRHNSCISHLEDRKMTYRTGKTRKKAAWYLVFPLIILLSACNLTTYTPTEVQQVNTPEALPTQPDPASSPVVVEPEPTPSDEGMPVFNGGFMVLRDGRYQAIDYYGQPMGFEAAAGGTDWVNDALVGTTKKSVVYGTNEGLTLIEFDGQKKLEFAGTQRISSVEFSRDASRIAWVTEEIVDMGANVTLWMANADGSNPVRVYELTAEETRSMPSTFEILGWTADGKLLFGTKASGIGGYILFGGWINLYSFDPASGVITDLYINDGSSSMCVNSISEDLSMVAVGCKIIQIQNLQTGSMVDLPAVAEQNFAGSAIFSPTGTRVAYGTGRGNPEDEGGKLVVAPSDGSGDQQILAEINKGYFQVLGWIDEEHILYRASAGFDADPSVWRVSLDGSAPVKLADGLFVGFIY